MTHRTMIWRSLAATVFILCAEPPAIAQTIDEERQENLSKLGLDQMPDRAEIASRAVALFALPIEEQSEPALRELATAANVTANLIDFIYEEYDEFRRDNGRYDFVTEKVDPVMDQYGTEEDKFKLIRNRAYFNLGVKAKAAGQDVSAFLYFRDAFRLSAFDCGNGPIGTCMRWQAEKEMQKLLGLSHIKAFVTWQ